MTEQFKIPIDNQRMGLPATAAGEDVVGDGDKEEETGDEGSFRIQ